jgi:HicB family
VLTDLIEHLREIGKEIPAPQVVPEEFSGRVTFRMPRSLHARVDTRAQVEGVSINTWLVAAAENYLSIGVASVQGGVYRQDRPGLTVSPGAIVSGGDDTAVVVMRKAVRTANTTYETIRRASVPGLFSIGTFDYIDNDPDENHPIHRHFVPGH